MKPARLTCLLLLSLRGSVQAAEPTRPARGGCIECHQQIEAIREEGSAMLAAILEKGASLGDPNGCVVCHGGDPREKDKEGAHRGTKFYPAPGSPWVNEETCGQCHPSHVRAQWQSLMMTEAGKIQGVAWTFGGLTGYEHRWGNYDVENPKDSSRRLGTDTYRSYMERLRAREPQVFVDRHTASPEAPTDLRLLIKQPELAAFTYLRNQC